MHLFGSIWNLVFHMVTSTDCAPSLHASVSTQQTHSISVHNIKENEAINLVKQGSKNLATMRKLNRDCTFANADDC